MLPLSSALIFARSAASFQRMYHLLSPPIVSRFAPEQLPNHSPLGSITPLPVLESDTDAASARNGNFRAGGSLPPPSRYQVSTRRSSSRRLSSQLRTPSLPSYPSPSCLHVRRSWPQGNARAEIDGAGPLPRSSWANENIFTTQSGGKNTVLELPSQKSCTVVREQPRLQRQEKKQGNPAPILISEGAFDILKGCLEHMYLAKGDYASMYEGFFAEQKEFQQTSQQHQESPEKKEGGNIGPAYKERTPGVHRLPEKYDRQDRLRNDLTFMWRSKLHADVLIVLDRTLISGLNNTEIDFPVGTSLDLEAWGHGGPPSPTKTASPHQISGRSTPQREISSKLSDRASGRMIGPATKLTACLVESSQDGQDELSSLWAHRFMLASRSGYFAHRLLSSSPACIKSAIPPYNENHCCADGSSAPHDHEDNHKAQCAPTSTKTTPSVRFPPHPLSSTAVYFTLGFMYTGTLTFSNLVFDLSVAMQMFHAANFLDIPSLPPLLAGMISQVFCHGFSCPSTPEGSDKGSAFSRGGSAGLLHPCDRCARRVPRVYAFTFAAEQCSHCARVADSLPPPAPPRSSSPPCRPGDTSGLHAGAFTGPKSRSDPRGGFAPGPALIPNPAHTTTQACHYHHLNLLRRAAEEALTGTHFSAYWSTKDVGLLPTSVRSRLVARTTAHIFAHPALTVRTVQQLVLLNDKLHQIEAPASDCATASSMENTRLQRSSHPTPQPQAGPVCPINARQQSRSSPARNVVAGTKRTIWIEHVRWMAQSVETVVQDVLSRQFDQAMGCEDWDWLLCTSGNESAQDQALEDHTQKVLDKMLTLLLDSMTETSAPRAFEALSSHFITNSDDSCTEVKEPSHIPVQKRALNPRQLDRLRSARNGIVRYLRRRWPASVRAGAFDSMSFHAKHDLGKALGVDVYLLGCVPRTPRGARQSTVHPAACSKTRPYELAAAQPPKQLRPKFADIATFGMDDRKSPTRSPALIQQSTEQTALENTSKIPSASTASTVHISHDRSQSTMKTPSQIPRRSARQISSRLPTRAFPHASPICTASQTGRTSENAPTRHPPISSHSEGSRHPVSTRLRSRLQPRRPSTFSDRGMVGSNSRSPSDTFSGERMATPTPGRSALSPIQTTASSVSSLVTSTCTKPHSRTPRSGVNRVRETNLVRGGSASSTTCSNAPSVVSSTASTPTPSTLLSISSGVGSDNSFNSSSSRARKLASHCPPSRGRTMSCRIASSLATSGSTGNAFHVPGTRIRVEKHLHDPSNHPRPSVHTRTEESSSGDDKDVGLASTIHQHSAPDALRLELERSMPPGEKAVQRSTRLVACFTGDLGKSGQASEPSYEDCDVTPTASRIKHIYLQSASGVRASRRGDLRGRTHASSANRALLPGKHNTRYLSDEVCSDGLRRNINGPTPTHMLKTARTNVERTDQAGDASAPFPKPSAGAHDPLENCAGAGEMSCSSGTESKSGSALPLSSSKLLSSPTLQSLARSACKARRVSSMSPKATFASTNAPVSLCHLPSFQTSYRSTPVSAAVGKTPILCSTDPDGADASPSKTSELDQHQVSKQRNIGTGSIAGSSQKSPPGTKLRQGIPCVVAPVAAPSSRTRTGPRLPITRLKAWVKYLGSVEGQLGQWVGVEVHKGAIPAGLSAWRWAMAEPPTADPAKGGIVGNNDYHYPLDVTSGNEVRVLVPELGGVWRGVTYMDLSDLPHSTRAASPQRKREACTKRNERLRQLLLQADQLDLPDLRSVIMKHPCATGLSMARRQIPELASCSPQRDGRFARLAEPRGPNETAGSAEQDLCALFVRPEDVLYVDMGC